jgi:hypothetical protein
MSEVMEPYLRLSGHLSALLLNDGSGRIAGLGLAPGLFHRLVEQYESAPFTLSPLDGAGRSSESRRELDAPLLFRPESLLAHRARL